MDAKASSKTVRNLLSMVVPSSSSWRTTRPRGRQGFSVLGFGCPAPLRLTATGRRGLLPEVNEDGETAPLRERPENVGQVLPQGAGVAVGNGIGVRREIEG